MGSSPVRQDLAARRGKEAKRRPARLGRSEGRTPTAKEERAERKLAATVGGEGLAHWHSGKGERPGVLLLDLETLHQWS